VRAAALERQIHALHVHSIHYAVSDARGPAPVDRQHGSGDRRCGIARQEQGEGGDFVDGDELLIDGE